MIGAVFFYVFSSLALIVFLIYFSLIWSYSTNWSRMSSIVDSDSIPETKFSIVIPFRNEADHLSQLLKDLINLDYHPGDFEVILVDDHSEDDGFRITSEVINTRSNFHLFKSPGSGKKNALETGIEKSTYDIIVTTDADCQVSPGWLKAFAWKYASGNYEMILGPVIPYKESSFYEAIQALEFMSLIGSSAGAAESGHAIMCNGANLSYKKSFILSLKDPMSKDYASGDDMFLMMKIKERDPKKIGFLKSKEASVYTKMQPSALGFINQRIRWASKIRYYFDLEILAVALLVYFTNMVLLTTLGMAIYSLKYLWLLLGLLLLKAFIDFSFLRKLTSYFNKDYLLRYFIPTFLLTPFYTCLTGFTGLVIKSFLWKGRPMKVKSITVAK